MWLTWTGSRQGQHCHSPVALQGQSDADIHDCNGDCFHATKVSSCLHASEGYSYGLHGITTLQTISHHMLSSGLALHVLRVCRLAVQVVARNCQESGSTCYFTACYAILAKKVSQELHGCRPPGLDLPYFPGSLASNHKPLQQTM